MPRISVILPVYNAQDYLHDALQGLFMQTYQDFEVIAINDGSTDKSGEILDRCKDKRLKVVHQHNHGLALTLNRGIQQASGELIARQDADDISLPERFAKQIEYLDHHPQCGLLGTHAMIWENQTKTKRMIRHPSENVMLQLYGLFNCLFVHSSVMARTQTMIDAGLYPTDPDRNPPEDFDLWLRMMKQCEVANLAIPLLIYREVATGITQTKMNLLQTRTHQIACENMAMILGYDDPKECSDFVAVMRFDPKQLSVKPDWGQCQEWLNQLRLFMLRRFPNESVLIDSGIAKLRRRLQLMSMGHGVLGRSGLSKGLGVARATKRWICASY